MDKSIKAALQLFNYGLTPIPLIGKKPILKNWSNRFIDQKIKQQEIVDGFIDSEGKIITFSNKNIGIVTGQVSNCTVLDIDDMAALAKLESIGKLPLTWRVHSNRGIHLYFNYNKAIPSMKLWGSIDILSDKKQVVAPPSIHPNGKTYRWDLSPKQIEKADLPQWLIEYLLNRKSQNINQIVTNQKNHIYKVYKNRDNYESVIIQSLLENVDWIEFYSRFTSNFKGNGEWISARCPFHKDQHNSFSFNKKDGGWICFSGCGSGNGLMALKAIHHIDTQKAIQMIKGEI